MGLVQKTIVYIDLPGDGFVPAGQLSVFPRSSRKAGTFAFRYGEHYLRRSNAIALDPERLPFPDDPKTQFESTESGEDLFGGIRDAAPDKWGRQILDMVAGRPLGEFEYVSASGSGRVGALAFGPDLKGPLKVYPSDSKRVINEKSGDLIDMDLLIDMAEDLSSVDPDVIVLKNCLDPTTGLGGGQPKAAMMFDGKAWLAKFPAKSHRYSDIRREFAVMTLASECDFDVPEVRVISYEGTDIYLIERFDREIENGQIVGRVPFVSAYTMLGDENDMSSHHHSYGDIVNAMRKHCGGVKMESQLKDLYRRVAFNVFCNNDDDHVRNYGFLHKEGSWRLSPVYDVMPRIHHSTDHRTALMLGQNGREATIENLLSAAPDFFLSRDEASSILENLKAKVSSRWRSTFEACGVDDHVIEMSIGCFDQADREFDFKGELPSPF